MEKINQNNTQDEEKSNLGIQDYLSIGYIYLLILGVFHETIYYKFLDVNILEYSSVLDVLISPVSVISSDLRLAVVLSFAVVLAYVLKYLLPYQYRYLAKKDKYQSGKYKIKLEKAIREHKSSRSTIVLIAFMLFSVFIGMGFGRGMKTKRIINEEKIEYTHELIFEDNQSEKIKMLGKNSLYVFYVTEDKGDVLISPIEGNIKTIKKMKKKD